MVHAYNLQIIVGEILRYLCDLYEALGSLATEVFSLPRVRESDPRALFIDYLHIL
jgi:hypothetical protein